MDYQFLTEDARFVAEGVSIPISEVRTVTLRKTLLAKCLILFEWGIILGLFVPACVRWSDAPAGDYRDQMLGQMIAILIVGGLSEAYRTFKGWRLHIVTPTQKYTISLSEK